METDAELLNVVAAKLNEEIFLSFGRSYLVKRTESGLPLEITQWNPLNDNADAFRLAVRCKLAVSVRDGYATVLNCLTREACGTDSYAAARRVIVRAVAEKV